MGKTDSGSTLPEPSSSSTPPSITSPSKPVVIEWLFGSGIKSLTTAPELGKLDDFPHWKDKFINWLKTNNAHYLVLEEPTVSWARAQADDQRMNQPGILLGMYRNRHTCIAAALDTAVFKFVKPAATLKAAKPGTIPTCEWPKLNGTCSPPNPEDNAYLMWQYIMNNYDKRALPGIITPLNQLVGLKFTRGTNVSTHVEKFQELCREIDKILGARDPTDLSHFSEPFKVNLLINSLPASMQSLKDQILIDTNATVQSVMSQLQTTEAHYNVNQNQTAHANLAVHNKKPPYQKGNKGFKQNNQKGQKPKQNHYNSKQGKPNKKQYTDEESRYIAQHTVGGDSAMIVTETTWSDSALATHVDTADDAEYQRIRCILDSGCTRHLIRDKDLLLQIQEGARITVNSASKSGTLAQISHYGTLPIARDMFLPNCGVCPNIRENLISLAVLLNAGFSLKVEGKNTALVLAGQCRYYLP